ncbi:hypothetical protein AVEN_246955-1 [Araneus ventricosus]|uniref:Uncharacterized protein n=1 Tax=Araneus ventricosus TaxID=182803 RepID=A0A4Y2JNG2_ARAVE|nr:hypothetical protein AVEN_246955-1 [Araneus ventricosus]
MEHQDSLYPCRRPPAMEDTPWEGYHFLPIPFESITESKTCRARHRYACLRRTGHWASSHTIHSRDGPWRISSREPLFLISCSCSSAPTPGGHPLFSTFDWTRLEERFVRKLCPVSTDARTDGRRGGSVGPSGSGQDDWCSPRILLSLMVWWEFVLFPRIGFGINLIRFCFFVCYSGVEFVCSISVYI